MTTTSPAQRSNLVKHIEGFAEQRLIRPDTDLDNTLSKSRASGLPDIAISPMQGQYLSILCQLTKSQRVLEVGTLGGYSTMWFAKAGAQVTSIELNPKHRDVALENLHAAGLDADILLGAALDVLPNLSSEGKQFDFVFIDAAWGEQWDYFDWAVKLVKQGGSIYVDNVVQTMLRHDAGEDSLLARVGRDARVAATMVPTLSSHKAPGDDAFVDGFLLAIRL